MMNMTHKMSVLCAFVMMTLVMSVILGAPQAHAQAALMPSGESCFQATTGINGMLGSLLPPTGGASGTSGNYPNVSLTGGTGTGATANITVSSGGVVTAVAVVNPGVNYSVGDTLSAPSGNIGNVTGFSVVVGSISINSSLAGGTVGMYVPGTLTASQTWQNAAQTILNTNPVQLDINGCALIYGTGTYRQILYDSLGNEVWDQLTYAPGTSAAVGGANCAQMPSTGTANAQIFTPVPPIYALVVGNIYCGIAGFTNSTAMTLQEFGTVPAPVEKESVSGLVALSGNEVIAGQGYLFQWDGTEFQLLNPSSTVGGSSAETTNVSPTYCAYSLLDGLQDTTTCVQNAINAACATSKSATGIVGGVLQFSKGIYYIKTGVSVSSSCNNITFVGQGSGSGPALTSGTIILSDNNCSGPIINFYSDATANYIYGGGVNNIAFYNSPAGGALDGSVSCKYPLIEASYGQQMNFEHIYAWLPYQAIKIISGLIIQVNDINLSSVLQDSPGSIEMIGTGTASTDPNSANTRLDNIYISNFFAGPSSVLTSGHKEFIGIWWHGFTTKLQIQDASLFNTYIGLKIDCTGGFAANISACPSSLASYNLQIQSSGKDLVDASDFQTIRFTDLLAHCNIVSILGGCTNAIKLYNNLFGSTWDAEFKGGQMDSAQNSCIDAEMQGLTISGMKIFGCNAGSSGGSGISIDTPVSSDIQGQHVFNGNSFCNRAGAAPTAAMVAILLNSGNDYVTATNNNFYLCGTGVQNNSGGSHVTVANNTGP